ncbi:MAG: hypothetical protein HQ555_11800 [Candidatus Aminicenantes bacterium]|nr:hypothetical protein [Candidatus Aminicenantes bacterium]
MKGKMKSKQTSTHATKLHPVFRMNETEKDIWNKMLKYDDAYFSDMRIEKKELIRRFGRLQFEEENGTWRTVYDDFPLWNQIPRLENWIIKIVNEKKMKAGGICVGERKTIKIAEGLNRNELKQILLHEMIHAYEDLHIKGKGYEVYRQFFLLYFFGKLKNKIGLEALNEIIENGLQFILLEDLHTPLFLLKSLDLDLRLKKPWGTIHSYRRADYFEQIQYKAKKKEEGKKEKRG